MSINLSLAQEYYEAIGVRCSSRTFTGESLFRSQIESIETLAVEPLGLASCGVSLVHRAGQLDHVFKGAIGSYGKTTGVSALLALLIPSNSGWRGSMESGYVGEQLVLKATTMGIGSCWNAGMYDFKRLMGVVPIGPDEKVASLVALGAAKTGPDRLGGLLKLVLRRKRVDQIASSKLLQSAGWIPQAVEAVRVAPSAINQQPWHLDLDAGDIVLSATKKGQFASIDLGIAMLHFRVAALAQGIDGRWHVESAERAVFKLAP